MICLTSLPDRVGNVGWGASHPPLCTTLGTLGSPWASGALVTEDTDPTTVVFLQACGTWVPRYKGTSRRPLARLGLGLPLSGSFQCGL